MIILPAIDLIGGKCVRLKQGRYDDVTIYNDSPLDQAFMFKEAGATWIHVVDLDAAKSGTPENHEIIKEISIKTGLKVDTGGGIRNMDTLSKWIEDYGVSRAVLGTAAVKDPEFTRQAIEKYGLLRGCVKGFFRILRCNPLARGGFDPVKENYRGKAKWLI